MTIDVLGNLADGEVRHAQSGIAHSARYSDYRRYFSIEMSQLELFVIDDSLNLAEFRRSIFAPAIKRHEDPI